MDMHAVPKHFFEKRRVLIAIAGVLATFGCASLSWAAAIQGNRETGYPETDAQLMKRQEDREKRKADDQLEKRAHEERGAEMPFLDAETVNLLLARKPVKETKRFVGHQPLSLDDVLE